MKVKTSVTLSEELLAAIDQEQNVKNRSVLIEDATWLYLRRRRRLDREKREFDKINQHADALNKEAFDVLDFQDLTLPSRSRIDRVWGCSVPHSRVR